MTQRCTWFVTVLLVLIIGGCDRSDDRSEHEPMLVGVSVAPQAWLTREILGARGRVVVLVPPGASPATYQPSDSQVTTLLRAAVFFRTGVPFESAPWFESFARGGRVPLVDLRAGIELRALPAHDHDHGHGHDHKVTEIDDSTSDPHIWTCPRLLKTQARTICDALADTDPDHAMEYRVRLADLERRLDALHNELESKLEPIGNRAFYVFHPAWGYFAHEYGLEQIAIEIQGKSPSDRELTELQRQARELGIATIFVQPQISPSSAGAVARAIDGQLVTLDPLAEDVPSNLLRVAEAIVANSRN